MERLDLKGVYPLPGQSSKDHKKFMAAWGKMNLGHVHGFPLWEKEVFSEFQKSFEQLSGIFSHYAKSGGAGSGSATSVEMMQQTELVNLALDVGIPTEAFPMNRVQGIFARADQDDNDGVGKAGDRALEMHEFLEAIVMLAFARANPRVGEVGTSGQQVSEPLPGCLLSLLHKTVLRKARAPHRPLV